MPDGTASLFERLSVGTAPPVAAEPVSLVIFGGSGDLAHRKLLPALYNLHLDGVLPPRTAIVGVGRPAKSDEEYRAFAKDGVTQFSRRPIDDGAWQAFAESLFFVHGSFEDSAAFASLGSHLLPRGPAVDVRADHRTAGARAFRPPAIDACRACRSECRADAVRAAHRGETDWPRSGFGAGDQRCDRDRLR
jgi:glucose-6-phosphate 1-dehydrogenase